MLANANSAAAIDSIAVPDAPWGEVFDKLLQMRGYQPDRVVLAPPLFRPVEATRHTPGIGSLSFEAEQPLDGARLKAALSTIDERYGEALWRIKGVLAIAGMRSRLVLQGVQGLMQVTPSTPWRMFEPQRSRLVLIGRDLDRDWLLAVSHVATVGDKHTEHGDHQNYQSNCCHFKLQLLKHVVPKTPHAFKTSR